MNIISRGSLTGAHITKNDQCLLRHVLWVVLAVTTLQNFEKYILAKKNLLFRCMRSVGRDTDRGPAGESPVRPGRILPRPVSPAAQQIRASPPTDAQSEVHQFLRNRTTFLRPTSGKDSHRNSYSGHASQWKRIQLALCFATWNTLRDITRAFLACYSGFNDCPHRLMKNIRFQLDC